MLTLSINESAGMLPLLLNGSFGFAQDDGKGMLNAGGFVVGGRWSVVGALLALASFIAFTPFLRKGGRGVGRGSRYASSR